MSRELPSHAEQGERFEELGEVLARPWGEGPVPWVAGPWLLATAQAEAGRPYTMLEPLGEHRLRRERLRSGLASLVDRPIRGSIVDGCLFLPATFNQERVLEPVAERLGRAQVPPKLRGRRRRASQLGKEAITAWRSLHAALDEAGVGAPYPSIGVLRVLLAAGRFLAYAEAVLGALSPRVVVLGSAHNGAERAFTHVARAAGIPTVYLPHAPALTVARINDLPFDYAGLRGPKEAELYQGHGADPGRIEVIGNPAVPARQPPAIGADSPVVFAVSPVPPETLRGQVELVRRGLGDQVVLAPHPRSDLGLLRQVAPPAWRISEGLTLDLLGRGASAVIQRSSGISLEALNLGIPVIQLSFPGDRPGYPLIQEPWVRSVSSAEQLADAVSAARRESGDPERRRELIGWARQWSWPLGAEAAELGAALVRRAAAEGARSDPIWDAWARS